MALVKTYLGREIHVDGKGKFSVTLPNRTRKESTNLKVVEKFIADFTPKGHPVTLVGRPGTYGFGKGVTVTGIVPADRRSKYDSAEPRLVVGRNYDGSPSTHTTSELVWPDASLEAEWKRVYAAWNEADKAYKEKLQGISERFRAATLPDIMNALETGKLPEGVTPPEPGE
jgi:hypothetical protein